MLKKKYIALISISTASLLFVSLIFTAINTFPELLKPEEEKAEEEIEETNVGAHADVIEAHVTHTQPEEDNEVVIVISNEAPSNDVVYIPDNDFEDFIVIDEPVMISNAVEPTKPDVQEVETTLVVDPKEDERVAETTAIIVDVSEANVIEEAPIIQVEEVVESVSEEDENVHYMSLNRYEESYHALNDEEAALKLDKQNEAIRTVENHKAHYEVLECTMLVIGVINVLSFLFVKRRKRRAYHI